MEDQYFQNIFDTAETFVSVFIVENNEKISLWYYRDKNSTYLQLFWHSEKNSCVKHPNINKIQYCLLDVIGGIIL